ncbi:MAG: prolyl aminopeptidase [Pseudomonadales bacterium]|nr:prolyl aminopeptidase [Halioglobus sp.]MCP5128880.1 prolyl aminopeptidase [Pseudomonadales bacterium]
MSLGNSTTLYPPIEPYATGTLAVSERHTLYYEEAGSPNGRPAVFLHGGPGVGIHPDYRRFFDPEHYRVVLLDQRGAGRSKPHAEIEGNTTWELVEDLEKLRRHLAIDNWVVMGGSWGSLLALSYAIKHPASVAGIIIRGIFLGRQAEIDWLFAPGGAAKIYPDEWARFIAPLNGRQDVLAAYHELLNQEDPSQALEAARSWSRWEGSMNALFPDPKQLDQMANDHTAVAIARLESNYSVNNFFMPEDNYILDNADTIANIPCHIIQGRYDIICPPISAWDLHQALPHSRLTIVPDGAHSPLDAGMASALVKASDTLRDEQA